MNQGLKTVGFMALISVVFITALATVNEATKSRIAQKMAIETGKSILYAFNIFPTGLTEDHMGQTTVTADIPWQDDEVLQVKDAKLKQIEVAIPAALQAQFKGTFLDGKSAVTIYAAQNEQGAAVAYGLPLYGKGLWGTIEGFGVISADLTTMLGLDFTKQSETPGLGARILEKEYKFFFRNLDIAGLTADPATRQPIIMLKQKEQTNMAVSTNSVQAITGATQTSQGVLAMINSNLPLYVAILQAQKEQQ